jgi:hypothetical protein
MTESEKKISIEEAWRLYELIETLHEFLHQPENYKTQDEVTRWLQSGVYDELKRVYYNVLGDWFPVDEQTGEVSPPVGVRRRFPK